MQVNYYIEDLTIVNSISTERLQVYFIIIFFQFAIIYLFTILITTNIFICSCMKNISVNIFININIVVISN